MVNMVYMVCMVYHCVYYCMLYVYIHVTHNWEMYIGVVSVVSQYNCVYYCMCIYMLHTCVPDLRLDGLGIDLYVCVCVYVCVYVCVCMYVKNTLLETTHTHIHTHTHTHTYTHTHTQCIHLYGLGGELHADGALRDGVCIECIGVVSVVSQYNCVYYCDTWRRWCSWRPGWIRCMEVK
jgi:hypothetical protein